MKAIIIGSGMSGLTAAAYLVRAGYQVTVHEQFSEIGGVTATLRQDGFGWDLGPLMVEGFGPGEPAGEVLSELGLDDCVRRVRDDRGVVFPDFSLWKPATYAGPYWRRERLKELFPEERDGLDRYYQFYDRVMDLMALVRRADRARGPTVLWLKARMWLAFRQLKAMREWSAQRMMDHFFRRQELKALYTGILADFVVRPSQFPGLGIPTVNVETAFDKRIPLVSKAGLRPSYHYISGGCGQLVEAMSAMIRARGGTIQANACVRCITITDGHVTGVGLDDEHHAPADLVLASGGAHETFLGLVGREHLPTDFVARVENVAFMESVLMVHVGIDFDPTPYQPAALCYYYGSYDIEGGVARCQNGEFHEGRDGFLIYVPSLHSPELAPPGHHAVTVYTIAPNRLRSGTWAERREELADKLLAEAERIMPGLRQRARVRVILTPDDFRTRTHLARHSFGGVAPVMGKEGVPHRTPIRGLWFIGAQSESRGGVGNVVAGARRAVDMIRKQHA
ncbi:MAG: phytoene desaturase family protein [Candidatus Binatia bacterium]